MLPNGLPKGGPLGRAFEAAGPLGGDMGRGEQRWPAFVKAVGATNLKAGAVAWSERSPGRPDFDLYLQSQDPRGQPLGEPVLVAGGPGNQVRAAVAGWCIYLFVAWNDDRADRGDIRGRWYDVRTLKPLSPDILVVRSPGWADEPVVMQDRNDWHRWWVYFSDDRSGQRDIYRSFVTLRLSDPAPPDPTANQEPVVTGPDDEHEPGLGQVMESAWLLTWTREGPAGSEILGWRHWFNNLPFGAPFAIAGGPGRRGDSTVNLRASGDDNRGMWWVAWSEDTGASLDVLSRDVWTNGRPAPVTRTLAGD
jgi:hypothetical protein